ncbi:MAG: ATP-binding protein [Bacteroidota bacterium]
MTGQSSSPKSIGFEIRPEFYRTWWFVSLVGLAFLIVLLVFFRYLYAERQRMELEIRVDEKTFELQQKVAELHRTNEDLERFAYVASHDLKTPLRTVISHLQLLERQYKGDLDHGAMEYIDFAVGSSRRMYDMINDLLAYAKVGRDQAAMEPVPLQKIIKLVEKSLSSALQERNAQIRYDDLPVITGIRSQWQTLFQNLIENGVKFNRSESPQIDIQAKESPTYWLISVRDNGIGIDEEYQHKIFEIFQRLYTDAEFPGTGIGLAICKRIVEAHNGSIWIESKVGEGTTFYFTIEKPEKL